MFTWIYDLSNWSLAVMFAVLFVGVTWFGIIFFRPIVWFWMRNQTGRNELVGNTISSLSVFYGLLMGLLAVASFSNFEEVENNVKHEATNLATLYHGISHYPEPFQPYLQDQIANYTLYTIEQVWPAQQRGEQARYDNLMVAAIQDNLLLFEPAGKAEEILHAATLRRFDAFIEARRARESGVNAGIPGVFWYVLALGALINIVLLWLFDMKLSVHLILGGIVAFFLSVVISVIVAMDNPLRGELSVSAEPYLDVYQDLMQ
jgi:hypothetical protein